jgi:lauroyl/myristoyl acyltransferase
VWPPPQLWQGEHLVVEAARRLPGRLGEEALAFLALAHGLVSGRHRRRALAWARSQTGSRRSRWSLACALLAFRGRYIASRNHLGVRDLAALRARVTIEGIDRLEAASRQGGVLLLGFHLGPLVDPVALRAFGYAITLGRREAHRTTKGRTPPWWVHPPQDLVVFPNAAWHVRALYEMRRRLEAGRGVYLAADGVHGGQAFPIDLPGGPLGLSAGWLSLRRATGATTLPMLSHRDGRRIVVTVHAALPAAVASLSADVAACRAHLTPLLQDYVRRFPAQCFFLAFRSPAAIVTLDPSDHPAPGA